MQLHILYNFLNFDKKIMSIVPLIIRPHLVPFFFQESEGKEYKYFNTAKCIVFHANISSIGRMIRLLLVKAKYPTKNIESFNLMLTISDTPSTRYKGEFYKQENGRKAILKLPEDINEDINDLLEDLFRLSFVNFIDGAIEFSGGETHGIKTKAITFFMEKYNLEEFGFSIESMRMLYSREKKKNALVSRFQKRKVKV